MAGDIEPGWDPNGSGLALSLMHSAAESAQDVYNFGSVGLCRPFGSGCQGNWSIRRHRPGGSGFGHHRAAADLLRKAGQDLGPYREPLGPRGEQLPSVQQARLLQVRRGHVPHPGMRRGRLHAARELASHAPRDPKAGWPAPHLLQPARRWLLEGRGRGGGLRDCRCERRAGSLLPLMPKEVPAEIVEDPEPVVSSDVMATLENAWRVGSHTEYTWVFAGSAGLDPRRRASPRLTGASSSRVRPTGATGRPRRRCRRSTFPAQARCGSPLPRLGAGSPRTRITSATVQLRGRERRHRDARPRNLVGRAGRALGTQPRDYGCGTILMYGRGDSQPSG